jgi:protein MpaA
LSSAAAATPPVSPAPVPAVRATTASGRAVTLGQSVEGRPVTLHLFGDTAVGPANTVLIIGGIHGNEPTSAGVCREFLALLQQKPDIWAGRCVAVIPEANPDGLARRLRTNKNLVDLNRNFPAANWKKTRRSSFFGGDAPVSQPETRLLVDLIEQLKPARIVSVHSMDDPCDNYDGPAEGLAKLMAAHNGYPVKSNIGYPTPGSFGSWAGIDLGIPVITLELPSRGTTAASWTTNREALVAFIRGDQPATVVRAAPDDRGE